MTVDKAVEIINKVIANTLEEYNQSPDSKYIDDQGVERRKPHPLDIVDNDDILFVLDMSLKGVALKAAPVSLIETNGSTASELRRISTDYYIRVPSEPVLGQSLDIDDGLSHAVVFKALFSLWRDFSEYEQKAESIINTYIQAYRSYIADLISGNVGNGAETYIRFSDNGTDWHDSYAPGDIFISFKKIDTDTWTPAIRFVGQNGTDGQDGAPGTPCSDTQFVALQDTPASYTGMGGKVVAVKSTEDGVEFVDTPSVNGGGASTFLELTDTPSAYTAGKFVSVNAAGDAIEFVDAPTGNATYVDDACDGTLTLDAKTYNKFYIRPVGDTQIQFAQFQNSDGDMVSAKEWEEYTFIFVSDSSVAIDFDPNESIFGDITIGLGSDSQNTQTTVTIMKMEYTGYDWYVVTNTKFIDANG